LGPTRVHITLNLAARLQTRDEKLWRRKEAYANVKKLVKLTCNCNTYHGGQTWTRKVVQEHLYRYGHDPTLRNVKLGCVRTKVL
jgi:hypothetical protein